MTFNFILPSLDAVLASLAQPLVDPASRTWWPLLGIAALVALAWTGSQGAWRSGARAWVDAALAPRLWLHPSARADVTLLVARRLIATLGWLPEPAGALALGVAVARGLDHALGVPSLPVPPQPWLGLAYAAVLFLAWDLSRYALHRAMHGWSVLWAFHQVHHSAEVLTPLSFHRMHPVESSLYTLRGVVVGGGLAGLAFWAFRGAATPTELFGVHAFGLVLNAATGNLRHSHVWLGFGPRWERWWLSPAQHQLHHGELPAENRCNYGTWLAVWDRWGGTLRLADRPPERLGLAPADRNHDPHDLWSMLVHPMLAVVRR